MAMSLAFRIFLSKICLQQHDCIDGIKDDDVQDDGVAALKLLSHRNHITLNIHSLNLVNGDSFIQG